MPKVKPSEVWLYFTQKDSNNGTCLCNEKTFCNVVISLFFFFFFFKEGRLLFQILKVLF
uniref:Uncharacterized protein n=1 Tax=Anguilla anguilla TaxID=7936 RepID=A0A0E9UA17_ANGAN